MQAGILLVIFDNKRLIGVTEAHLCQERKAEVSEDTPLSEDTGNDPSGLLILNMALYHSQTGHYDSKK